MDLIVGAASGTRLGSAALHVCEWMSTFTPTRVVTDAKPIHDYYRQRYGKDSTVIGYGSDIPSGDLDLGPFDLSSGRYVLYVSRLEPENNPELVLGGVAQGAHRLAAGDGRRQSLRRRSTSNV